MATRIILLLFFCVLTTFSNAQIIVNPSLHQTYDEAANNLSVEDRGMIIKINSAIKTISGFGIYAINKTDTLNKADFLPKPEVRLVHIFDLDTDKTTGKITKREIAYHAERENIVPLTAKLNNDTLTIVEFNFFGSSFIQKIFKDKISTVYNAYERHDDVLRLDISDAKTDNLMVPCKNLGFKLSSLDFKPGNVIYGEAGFISSPFYKDDYQSKSGYIKKQIHYKYMFKLTILENPGY